MVSDYRLEGPKSGIIVDLEPQGWFRASGIELGVGAFVDWSGMYHQICTSLFCCEGEQAEA